MFQRVLFPQTLLSLLLLLLCASYGFCDPLVNFQVAQPPPFPLVAATESTTCTVPILQRTFASSVGDPEIVQYTPPTDCGTPNDWAGISLNFTVTSSGTQYSRLGFFTFQNVEIWRTSTPKPVEGDGIIWTYIKDVTRFIPLFSEPGIFILQLDNQIDSNVDGEFATRLEATFFASSGQFPPAPRADLIVPLTTLANNTGDAASVPPGFSLDVTLPRNAVTAFAELQAVGDYVDILWYTKIPNDFLNYFPGGTKVGTAIGQGPFREVRVLVDGQVAGVAFPYPVINPGGLFPAAWRPIASYGAIDMPTYHLDLTPFIPILTDGGPHKITLDVASAELSDHAINQNWFLSGLLHVMLDSSTEPTTGKTTIYEAFDYATLLSASLDSSGPDRVNVVLNASRSIHIEAEIISGSGERTEVVFTQDLEFGSVQNYLHNFTTEHFFWIASGETISKHNGEIALLDTFSYPLIIDFAVTSPDGSEISVEIDHAYDRNLRPAPFLLGTTIVERQVAGGTEGFDQSGGTTTNGNSANMFNYVDTEGNTYTRQVNASNNVITFDNQAGTLAPTAVASS
ncbi:peptide N-acetyl-beta-D-glucosaminyl asparaginase amidase A-domain-containing protein [Lactarius psammicola]|nr:peptide N-acetyl-beta-D-glucosaminyl asparaginase amidase A-domain-containing protein [Lactarius psammicola]